LQFRPADDVTDAATFTFVSVSKKLLLGDANLDGTVNAADLNNLGHNFDHTIDGHELRSVDSPLRASVKPNLQWTMHPPSR
jgi:hypothetical protein